MSLGKADRKSGLGRGLTALLSDSDSKINSVATIPLDKISANPFQPRQEFDEDAIAELAASVAVHGVIQPITVRLVGEGEYQLIAGERRTRAARKAGLKEIPAYLRDAEDQAMLEMALIENIQRQDLNSMEVAYSYQRLIEECQLKQEELGNRVGKSRSAVTNHLRLLKLPAAIQKAIRAEKISTGHAKALLTLTEKPEQQMALMNLIIQKKLSVRQAEKLANSIAKDEKDEVEESDEHPIELEAIQSWANKLSEQLGRDVTITFNRAGKGSVTIAIDSETDLINLTHQLER